MSNTMFTWMTEKTEDLVNKIKDNLKDIENELTDSNDINEIDEFIGKSIEILNNLRDIQSKKLRKHIFNECNLEQYENKYVLYKGMYIHIRNFSVNVPEIHKYGFYNNLSYDLIINGTRFWYQDKEIHIENCLSLTLASRSQYGDKNTVGSAIEIFKRELSKIKIVSKDVYEQKYKEYKRKYIEHLDKEIKWRL